MYVYFLYTYQCRPGAEPKRINELTEDDAYLVSCEKFTSFIRFCVDEGKAHYLSKLTTSGLAVSKWKKKFEDAAAAAKDVPGSGQKRLTRSSRNEV